jgi:glutamate synthase (NADPH/NADH) small chain
LHAVNALEVEGASLEGVIDAVSYIADLRQAMDLARLPIGRRIAVVGGGNTAIDIAVQAKKLGAEEVTLLYRRGPGHMGATHEEQHFAQTEGVKIRHWVRPARLLGWHGKLKEIELDCTALDAKGRLISTDERSSLQVDQLFSAIGQILLPDPLKEGALEMLAIKSGKIVVNDERETSLAGIYAGGDCVATGADLTVRAVEDGKRAAIAIDRRLRG